MRRWKWMIILVVIGLLGTGTVQAEKAAFRWEAKPQITYNPIEDWRMGVGSKLYNIFGKDELQISVQNALFTTRDFSSLATYIFHQDQNDWYVTLLDELSYQGIFAGEGFYQRDQYVSGGVLRKVFEPNYYYVADLMVQARRMLPANQPAEFDFDEGTDLVIYPAAFGAYKGYLGKIQMALGVPTEYSDYKYVRANGLLKKGFDLTSKDRLVVSTEMGYIGGDYPTQQQFYLGSSEGNLVPNFKAKVIGKTSSFLEESVLFPQVGLDGFEDHAFYGDKMYVGKLEYQRMLLSHEDVPDMAPGMRMVGKVYTVFGEAWSGAFRDGFTDPKTAVGIGFQMDFPSLYPDMFMSFNLARGLDEEAATTFGIEVGSALQFAFMIGGNE